MQTQKYTVLYRDAKTRTLHSVPHWTLRAAQKAAGDLIRSGALKVRII
ncbi:hypothetical protein [Burkholderia cenocepacia]|nr:hypothetical protein [Burkholderia cenocepacia]